MPETVSDTGPVLHLEEIGELATLSTVAPLVFPDLVIAELEIHGVGPVRLKGAAIEFAVATVAASEWRAGTVGVLIRAYTSGRITRADLDGAIESLFNQSSLFISRAFRIYLKKLLSDLE